MWFDYLAQSGNITRDIIMIFAVYFPLSGYNLNTQSGSPFLELSAQLEDE